MTKPHNPADKPISALLNMKPIRKHKISYPTKKDLKRKYSMKFDENGVPTVVEVE